MRIIFNTWSAPSHFFPMVPLARAAQAAGHEVVVAAPPSCARAVREAGLEHRPVGRDLDVAATSTRGDLAAWHAQRRWPKAWPTHPERLSPDQHTVNAALGRKQLMVAQSMIGDLRALASGLTPDLIVHDAVTWAGRVVAEELGIPSVSHMWGSAAAIRLERQRLSGPLLPAYAELFEGREPVGDSSLWLDPCPPSLRLPGGPERSGIRIEPYNGPGRTPHWLASTGERPRVCVTWGVTAAKLAPGAVPPLFRRTVAALADLEAEILLAVPEVYARLLGDLPPAVRVVEDVPLRLLLADCSAIVHQGGGGTTMTAVAVGVPQMVISPRPEQMLTGEQLVARGAGRHRIANELDDDTDAGLLVQRDVRALLEQASYQRAATELAAETAAMPSPAAVVTQLEELAALSPAR